MLFSMVSSGSKNLKFSIKFCKYDIVFGSIQKVIQKSSVLKIGKAFTEMTGRICRRSGPSSQYISYKLSVYIFWRMIHIPRTGPTPATVRIASPANEQSPCSSPLSFRAKAVKGTEACSPSGKALTASRRGASTKMHVFLVRALKANSLKYQML